MSYWPGDDYKEGVVVVADKNTLTHLYLQNDIVCPNCGTVVVSVPRITM